MRNLKKILALVLALVMSLSLMATAGAADNSAAANSETISAEYQTAKDVLSALGIFKGYEDGTFKPKQSITRAEVATILYRMVTGDVASARSDIYGDMQQSTFTDLAGANWARGYINYCANAKLIVGVGGNKFQPSANITGYATLAMVLRALGYDKNGEFQGTGWEIRTASTARELGILNNVNAAEDLGKPATREMVAEILFRAMLCEKVQYNALTQDYTKTGVTLGYEVFKLEQVQGVVVANEYGDIRRDADGKGYNTVQPADRTVLRDADNKDRTIRIASGLDDLGMTRVVYTTEDKTVRDTYDLRTLAMEDPDLDDVTYDDGEYIAKVADKISGTEAVHYVNYGEENGETQTTIKITYQAKLIAENISGRTAEDAIKTFRAKYNLSSAVVDGDQLTSVVDGKLVANVQATYPGSGMYRIVYQPKDNGDVNPSGDRFNNKDHIYSVVTVGDEIYYRVEVAPGVTLTSSDEYVIGAIFTSANRNPATTNDIVIDGEVFRGTQSKYDYSDWRSYEDFTADCLKVISDGENTKVSTNGLGYRLRIIDNGKDGHTDWVFQTKYTVTTVQSVVDGKITLTTDETALNSWSRNDMEGLYADRVNSLSKNPTVVNEGSEELKAGDVVLYAVIDGVARVWKADSVEARVESINRTKSTITTADNTEYAESAVHEHSSDKEIIDSGVVNMAGKTAYTLYLDKYNNLAAFSQNLVGKLTLLTDGWSNVQKNGVEYAVKAWDKDTQAFVQYDITSGGNMFIGVGNSSNNWNRIARFNPLNCVVEDGVEVDDIHTIMAYVENDGENATLVPVDMVYDTQRLNANRSVKMIDMGTTIPTSGWTYGDIWQTGTNGINWDNGYYNDPNGFNGVYGYQKDHVEVRALADTTYYFVYRTWYGTTATMVVKQFTGYSNADWNKLATINNAYVEDVYVVGTESVHVTADGTANQTYYTANAVVVELNDEFYANFKNDHEEIFVYDFENVINSVNLEKVKAINEKGEDVEYTIDLTRSDRVYIEGQDKYGEPAPGLFYVWRTDAAGDVWAISRMTHQQIRESGHYDVGTVAYSRFTFAENYANIYNYYCYNSGSHWSAGHPTHNDMTAAGNAVLATANRIDNENAKYYTLGYTTRSYGPAATLTKVDAATALSEHANDIANGATNEVLVRYNAGNNNIVYAVSFNHAENNHENFAQSVYRGVLMDFELTTVAGVAKYAEYQLNQEAARLTAQYPDKAEDIQAALDAAIADVEAATTIEDVNNALDAGKLALKNAAENGEVKYNVTIDETIKNGTVEAHPATAAEGETVTLTAIPDEGYVLEVESITVTADDGTDIEVVDDAFTMPAQNVKVSATFVLDDGGEDYEGPVTVTVELAFMDGEIVEDWTDAGMEDIAAETAAPGQIELTADQFVSEIVKITSADKIVNLLVGDVEAEGNYTDGWTVPVDGETVTVKVVVSSFDDIQDAEGGAEDEGGDTPVTPPSGNGDEGVEDDSGLVPLSLAQTLSDDEVKADYKLSFTIKVNYDLRELKLFHLSLIGDIEDYKTTTDEGKDVYTDVLLAKDGTEGTPRYRILTQKEEDAASYTVAIDETVENGTVTADVTEAKAGDTVTLTVTPAENYDIASVTYTPAEGEAVTVEAVEGVYSFEMPAANVTVSASFTAKAEEPVETTVVVKAATGAAEITAVAVKDADGKTLKANPANTFAAKTGDKLTVELTVTATTKSVVVLKNTDKPVVVEKNADGKYVYEITVAEDEKYTFRTTDGELELFYPNADGNYTTNWFEESSIESGVAVINIADNATAGMTINDVVGKIVTGLGVKPEIITVYNPDHVVIPESEWTRYAVVNTASTIGSIILTVDGKEVTVLEAGEQTRDNVIYIKDEDGKTIKTANKGEQVSLDLAAGYYAIDSDANDSSKHYVVNTSGNLEEIAAGGTISTAALTAPTTVTFTIASNAVYETLTVKEGYWKLTVNGGTTRDVKAGKTHADVTGLTADDGNWYYVVPAGTDVNTLTESDYKQLVTDNTNSTKKMVPNFVMPAGNTTVGTKAFKVTVNTVGTDSTTTEVLFKAKDETVPVEQGNKAIVLVGTTESVVDASSSDKTQAIKADTVITKAAAARISSFTLDGETKNIVLDKSSKINWGEVLADAKGNYVTMTVSSNYLTVNESGEIEDTGATTPVHISLAALKALNPQTLTLGTVVTTGLVKLTINYADHATATVKYALNADTLESGTALAAEKTVKYVQYTDGVKLGSTNEFYNVTLTSDRGTPEQGSDGIWRAVVGDDTVWTVTVSPIG